MIACIVALDYIETASYFRYSCVTDNSQVIENREWRRYKTSSVYNSSRLRSWTARFFIQAIKKMKMKLVSSLW